MTTPTASTTGSGQAGATKSTPIYDHVLDDPLYKKEVYEPEADSFLLLDALDLDRAAIRDQASNGGVVRILEIGCGSGIAVTHAAMIAVMLDGAAQNGDESAGPRRAACMAIDVNPIALKATRTTFERSIPASIRCGRTADSRTADGDIPDAASAASRASIELVRGDLMMPLSMRAKFDVLIFNPPYVPTSVDELNEAVADARREKSWICAAWAGGPAGRLVVDRVLPVLHHLLEPVTGAAYIIALNENLMEDMIAMVEHFSQGRLTGSVFLSRWTGEKLNVLKFFWRREVDGDNAKAP